MGASSFGSFASPVLATADFNRDGKMDIATANNADGTVTILLGDGTGKFTQAPSSPLKSPSGSISTIATGDFNGDGNADLVASDRSITWIWAGDGSGGFVAGATIQTPTVQAVFVSDLNRDGKLDILEVAYGSAYTLLGDGTGNFEGPLLPASNLSPAVADVALGDFNGDGKTDIATVDAAGISYGSILVLNGDGTGHFTGGSLLYSRTNPAIEIYPAVSAGAFVSGGTQVLALVGGDAFLFSYGKGYYNIATTPLGRFDYPLKLVSADFNGDGKVDFARVSFDGLVDVFLGDGTGKFTLASGSPYAAGGSPVGMAAADFNGDGLPDLAVDTGSSVVVLLNGASSPGSLEAQLIQFQPFLQFLPPDYATFVTRPFAISASASSGLPVTLSSLTPAVCTLSGSTVTIVGVGTCSIMATQPGNSEYSAAPPVTLSTVVHQAAQLINDFPVILPPAAGTGPVSISASTTSGLPVAFSSQPPSVCTVAGNMLTPVSVGACAVTASQPGNTDYTAAQPVTRTVNVELSQTITFPTPANQRVGVPATLVASATSGLPVSFTSSASSALVCAVFSSNQVYFAGAGTCTVTASQSGNSTYAAAPPVSQSFTVAAAPISQTIDFPTLPTQQAVGTSLSLTAWASSGLPVIFASNTPSVCTVNGNSANMIAPGVCSITASQGGNSTYPAAPPNTQTFAVVSGSLQSQTITFGKLSDRALGAGAFGVSATASSGLPVSFASATLTVCTVAGSTVTLISEGICGITATQGGNATYNPAPAVSQSFNVLASALAKQTITFAPLSGVPLTFGTVTVSATASSGLPVSFSSGTPTVCTVSGNIVTLLSGGTCGITASQGGNSAYNAAPPVSQSFTVSTAALTQQTITFALPASVALAAGTATLTATASSGLPVTFSSSTPSICNAAGATVTLLAAGTCTIVASQSGNSAYQPAPSITQSFTVTAATQTGPVISTVENAASYASGPVTPGSYAILFGSNLAAQAGDPSVAVSITDAAGKQSSASIIYAGTAQVNIFVPANVALGSGTVTLTNNSGSSTPFPIAIGNIAPGLFTVDTSGTIPAAQVITTASDGSQVVQPVANCSASGCALVPIVLNPSVPSYLILYGTGMRGVTNLADFNVTIGGVYTPVEYAGPQGGYPGLDQVNLLIPAALAGTGQVSLDLAIFTTSANPVLLDFQ